MTENPNFRDHHFLIDHVKSILAFYDPVCVDSAGGFYQYFRDDGSIYEPHMRHLVSSARFVFNYAQAGRWFARDDYLQLAEHGLDYLEQVHFNPDTGGYIWTLDETGPTDTTNHCYGVAFVLLAYATATHSGSARARAGLRAVYDLMDRHFWDADAGLYKDEANADFSRIDDYRGQNANMHSCEALIASFEATGDQLYLSRARDMAHRVTVELAARADDLIWEHYDTHWQPDWNYNIDNPRHLFRPWGYQPGHQTEWCKLLLMLHEHLGEDWMLDRARHLFDRALDTAWDDTHGGICYGFDRDGKICDDDKYFWVQAESFAAAARLAKATGEPRYWQWYEKIWDYSWRHMVDHRYGAWYRILKRNNEAYDDLKSPAGKTDYHTMGACLDVLVSQGLSPPWADR